MREQRAAGDRAGHHLGGLDNGRGQHIEKILGEAPDRRRVAEQLVGIEVGSAVVAVAEIEVAIEHQYFVPLQVLERLLAYFVPARHRDSRRPALAPPTLGVAQVRRRAPSITIPA